MSAELLNQPEPQGLTVIPAPRRRSGGPKTLEGRARSSMNALKHGKYAQLATVLLCEDPVAYKDHHKAYVERFRPADRVEQQLVSELASIDWRLNRILAVETRSVDLQVRVQNAATEFERYQLSKLAAGIRKLTDDSNVLEQLSRKEQILTRARQTVLDALFTIREKQPRMDRTRIPNDDNYIDPETIITTDSQGGETNSPEPRTNSNELLGEPNQ